MRECLFCNIKDEKNIILENELSFAIYDEFPVSKGHLLVIPKRHVSDFFELSNEEHKSIMQLLVDAQKFIAQKYNPDGYNVGVNVGEAAGQSIFHVHVHLIPRYNGDVKSPKGGVRGVIPEKQAY